MTGRRQNETGSALMLAPAGVLVLLGLGAIAVDSAVAFMAHRELTNQATAAVNDAATLALDDAALQQGSEARIDSVKARELVRTRLEGSTNEAITIVPGSVVITVDTDAGTVSVTAEATSPYIFAPAIPGAKDEARVKVQVASALRHQAPTQ